MGEFGLKIKNYGAGSIYGYNLGVRDRYDTKDAMLTNSIFLDFLLENGLSTWKDKATRDVICIEFGYGTRSYEEELARVNKEIKDCQERKNEYKKFTQEQVEEKIARLEDLKAKVELNKDKYVKKSKQNIRKEFYVNGVDIEYPIFKRDGSIKSMEKIHYKMLYRTPGKAKKGSCMFINEVLYDKAINFLRMGIEMQYENAPIVEMGAYSSLITSSVVGKVRINPKNILILEDVDAFFETKVISIETDENKQCFARTIENYRLKNTLFDGQALIDHSIFPEWGDGYILLRHHFCKMAAFDANIQLFFKDYYGDDYYSAKVTDMFGVEHYVKDIELITTDNAMKWLKFNVSYDYWCDRVYENNCMFGIVKTAHASKLGAVQRMSYQMINALDYDIMPQVVQCTIDYIEKLKTDDTVFLNYLRDNVNFSNDFEVLIALCEQDADFIRSEYFRDRKRKIIEAYMINFKNGKVIQNADNLVIVGSPYAMLLHSVGEDPLSDPTFTQEDDAIQCWTGRFQSGDYLAEFRSPFNGKGNMGYLHNVHHEYFDKYFNLGSQIIAVNMIGTDFQSRNNGADQDSDSLYTTNQTEIVACAKYCYQHYPTIENNIPKETNKYCNTLENFANIDNNIAASQLTIGESSNLAQICLTYTYNYTDQKYIDYVCILSVLAQVAIDNAKRRFDIDLPNEIARIKSDMDINKNGYPAFWGIIRREFNKSKINPELKCPMNYIFDIETPKFRSEESTLPMSDFFVKFPLEMSEYNSKKAEAFIEKFSYALGLFNQCGDEEDIDNEYFVLQQDFSELIEDIKQLSLSKKYIGLMSWLIDRAFCITNYQKAKYKLGVINTNLNKNTPVLLKILYDINPNMLLKCFSKNIEK